MDQHVLHIWDPSRGVCNGFYDTLGLENCVVGLRLLLRYWSGDYCRYTPMSAQKKLGTNE